MEQLQNQIGIYVNVKEGKVVRIASSYWIPESPDWVRVTPEVNATLLAVRDLIREQDLYSKPEEVTWGQVPLRD